MLTRVLGVFWVLDIGFFIVKILVRFGSGVVIKMEFWIFLLYFWMAFVCFVGEGRLGKFFYFGKCIDIYFKMLGKVDG